MSCLRADGKTILFIRVPGAGGAPIERLMSELGETWGTGPVWTATELEAAYRPWLFDGGLAIVRDPIDRVLAGWTGPVVGAEWDLNEWIDRALYASSIYPDWDESNWIEQAKFFPGGKDWTDLVKVFDHKRREEAALWLRGAVRSEADEPFELLESPASLPAASARFHKLRGLLSAQSEKNLRERYSTDYELFGERFGWL